MKNEKNGMFLIQNVFFRLGETIFTPDICSSVCVLIIIILFEQKEKYPGVHIQMFFLLRGDYHPLYLLTPHIGILCESLDNKS